MSDRWTGQRGDEVIPNTPTLMTPEREAELRALVHTITGTTGRQMLNELWSHIDAQLEQIGILNSEKFDIEVEAEVQRLRLVAQTESTMKCAERVASLHAEVAALTAQREALRDALKP